LGLLAKRAERHSGGIVPSLKHDAPVVARGKQTGEETNRAAQEGTSWRGTLYFDGFKGAPAFFERAMHKSRIPNQRRFGAHMSARLCYDA
jgi:hypothetical protein